MFSTDGWFETKMSRMNLEEEEVDKELKVPITFIPTLRVEPEEDIEETPPISMTNSRNC